MGDSNERHLPLIIPAVEEQEESTLHLPYGKRMSRDDYEREKQSLQIELLKMQSWVKETGQKIVIVFEGRDAAGKDAAIHRFKTPRGD